MKERVLYLSMPESDSFAGRVSYKNIRSAFWSLVCEKVTY